MAHEVRVYYSNTSCFKQKNLGERIPGSGPLEMRPLPWPPGLNESLLRDFVSPLLLVQVSSNGPLIPYDQQNRNHKGEGEEYHADDMDHRVRLWKGGNQSGMSRQEDHHRHANGIGDHI